MGTICKVEQFVSHLCIAVYGGLGSPVEQSNIGNVFLLQCLPPPPPPPPPSPPPSPPPQQLLGQNGDQLCSEGEMSVQQIMDALHVALIPSPDSQTSFPPSPDLNYLL